MRPKTASIRRMKLKHGPLCCNACRSSLSLNPDFDGEQIVGWQCGCGHYDTDVARLTPEEWERDLGTLPETVERGLQA